MRRKTTKRVLAFLLTLFAFYIGHNLIGPRELAKSPIESPEKPKYILYTLPLHHVQKLEERGFEKDEIMEINEALERHRKTDAYRQFSNPIPLNDFYLLATYASVVVGGDIDPLVLTGVHYAETIKKIGVGECSFVPDKEGVFGLVRGASGDDSERFQRRFEAEKAAFLEIFKKINTHLRKPLYRMQAYWPLASCGAGALGPMQIMPSNWIRYERVICREICGSLRVVYASPYHIIPAIFGAALILKDVARAFRVEPASVQLDDPETVKLISAGYYAGPRNALFHVKGYGALVYRNSLRASKEIFSE